jgi:hypothetical protein
VNSKNLVQAIWPSVWLLTSIGTFFQEKLTGAVLVTGSFFWLISALVLSPKRKWTWWTCLAPLCFAFLLGLVCFGAIAHMFFFGEFWQDSHQPGAVALLGGLYLTIPSALLMVHLLAIRGRHILPRTEVNVI